MYNNSTRYSIPQKTAVEAVKKEEGLGRAQQVEELAENGYNLTYVDHGHRDGGTIIIGGETSIEVSETHDFIEEVLTE